VSYSASVAPVVGLGGVVLSALTGALTGLVTVVPVAQAQTTPQVSPKVSPPITPQSRPQSSPAAPDVDPIDLTITERILRQPVYAPSRGEATVGDATRPVYVINRAQIEAQGFRSVKEALRYVPGILGEGTAGGQLGANGSQIIRGAATAQVLILLDGKPMNDSGRFGGFDLSQFGVDNVERIEVLPGGASSLYGSDAVGGVINIVTRAPGERSGSELRLAVGSFGLNEQAIRTSGKEGNLSWTTGYSRIQSANTFPFTIDSIGLSSTRNNADVTYNNVDVKLAAKLGNRDTLTFDAQSLNRDLGVPGGVAIPGTSGAFNSLNSVSRQSTQDWLLGLTWQSRLGEGNDSDLMARVFANFSTQLNNDPTAFGSRDNQQSNSLGLQVQHNWQFAANQKVTYGFDYRNTSARNETFDYSTSTNTTNYDNSIGQGAIFARYEIQPIKVLTIHGALRQDFSSLVNGSYTSPSGGVRWAVTDSTALRANYANSFRAPIISDLYGFKAFNIVGNPNLKPERGSSFDVGLDQKLWDFGLFRFTYFSNTITDLINFKFGTPSTYENIGEVRSTGIETTLNVNLGSNISAFANYTLNDPRITSNANVTNIGKELPFRGADTFNLGLAYELPSGFYGAAILRNVSSFFVDTANKESLAGYTAIDLKFRLPMDQNITLTAGIDNLFDVQSQQYPGFPGVGRSFRIGFNAKF